MCKPVVIARKENIVVTHCVNCKIANIWNRGMLISFSFQQFDAFIKATENLKFDDFIEQSPDGTPIVVLATPYPDISLVFNRKEWGDFFDALHEGKYMQEIYSLVHF